MKRFATKFNSPLFLNVGLAVAILFILLFFIGAPIIITLLGLRGRDLFIIISPRYQKVALNTLIMTLTSTAFATLIGFFYAYVIATSRIYFSRFFALMPIIHLVTPPVVSGLSFILLFGRRGLILHSFLHLGVSLYGFWGIVFSQVLYFFPISYVINTIFILSVNSQHIAAARLMGAGSLRVFFTITLPESSMGLFSSALFVAVSVMSDFGNPAIVGGRFSVLSTEIYGLVNGAIDGSRGAALSLFLLLPSIALFALQNAYFLHNRERFSTIGSNSAFVPLRPRPCSRVLGTLFCAFFSFIILLQLLSIILGTFQRLWVVDPTPTFQHIKHLTNYLIPFRNTFLFSLVATLITIAFSILTAYFSTTPLLVGRRLRSLSRLIDLLALFPQAICGVMLGLSYSHTAGLFQITNYTPLVIAVMVVMFLPFAHKTISTSFLSQKEQLTLCAITLGATPLGSLLTVTLPLSFGAVRAAAVYTFSRCMGTLSAVIFLVSFSTKTISLFILNLTGQGSWGESCALSLCLTILSILIIILAVKLPLWKKKTTATQ